MRHAGRLILAVALMGVAARTAAAQQPIHWHATLEEAQQAASQTNRLVLIHFWAPWCKPCLQMEQTVFNQPEVGPALEARFVLVKLNADDWKATARMYGVASLPTDVIITSTGRLVAAIQSPPTAAQYVAKMTNAADGHKQLNQSPYANLVRDTTPQNPYGAVAATQQAPNTAAAVQPTQQYAGSPQQNPGYTTAGQSAAAQPATTQFTSAPGGGFTQQQPGYSAAPMNAATGQSIAPAGATPPPAAAAPSRAPIALDGFCPVTLVERRKWGQGDRRWGAVHLGRTYLFASQEAQQRFLANPDAYSPVMQGNDPVLSLDNRQVVPGSREHGMYHLNRVYLFSSEESLRRFQQNPGRYEAEVMQAMRQSAAGQGVDRPR